MVGNTLKNLGNRLVTDAPTPSTTRTPTKHDLGGHTSSSTLTSSASRSLSPSASFSQSPSRTPSVASIRSLDGQMSEMGVDALDALMSSGASPKKGDSGR